MSDNTNTNPTTTTRATLRYDELSRLHWLETETKPDEEIRQQLKANGWRWSGYRKEWYTNRRFPTVPPTIAAEEAGTCDYASERADRLEARAEKHAAKSHVAYERSSAAVAHIPLGQPILVGHYSERMHRAALKRSHAAMNTSVAEAKTADHLQQKAEASRRHQAHADTPEALTRRAEKLEAEHRAMARTIEERTRQLAQRGQEQTESDREYQRRADLTAQEAAGIRQRIAEAGGIAADRLEARTGDLVKIHGFTGIVQRVNPKTYTVQISQGWPLKLHRSWLTAIIARAEEIEKGIRQ